jgi:hypothetical protein
MAFDFTNVGRRPAYLTRVDVAHFDFQTQEMKVEAETPADAIIHSGQPFHRPYSFDLTIDPEMTEEQLAGDEGFKRLGRQGFVLRFVWKNHGRSRRTRSAGPIYLEILGTPHPVRQMSDASYRALESHVPPELRRTSSADGRRRR